MKHIKFLKSKNILLDNKVYKPYLIGILPSLFAFEYDANEDKDGITEWFNYKGLTYIPA